MNAFLTGLEQAREDGQGPVDDPLGRLVLRLPRRHRDRQAARRDRHRRGQGAQGQGRRRQRPARLPGLRGGLLDPALEEPRGRRRPRAAPAVGLHRRQGPGLPRHALRHRAGRPEHRQHDAREDARRGRRPRRGHRRHRHRQLRRRRRGARRPRGPGHLLRRGHRASSSARASTSSRSPGASCSTRPRTTSTSPAPTWSRRATSELTRRGRVRRRGRRHRRQRRRARRGAVREQALRPGPHAVGPGRRVRVGHAALLGRPRPAPRGRWSARSPRCATQLRGEGVDRVVLCGMGGSSLAPEVICATAGVRPRRARLLRPRHGPRPRSTDLDRTVVVVSSKSGSTVETDSPAPRVRGGLHRRRHRPDEPHRHRHRPGQPARRAVARAAATASSTPTPTSAAATPR